MFSFDFLQYLQPLKLVPNQEILKRLRSFLNDSIKHLSPLLRWGISLFNLPDPILASKSGILILGILKKKKKVRTFLTLFPHLPVGYFLSTPGTAAPTFPLPRPTSRPTAGGVRDIAHEHAHWSERWDPWEGGGYLSDRHITILKTSFLQRNSQMEKDPTVMGCLKGLFSEENNWALFVWAWAQVQSLREFMERI